MMDVHNKGTVLDMLAVKYVSGLTGLVKMRKSFFMQLYTEGFYFFGNNFPSLWIPYNSVIDFNISRDGLGLWNQSRIDTHNERMIDIVYLNPDREKVSLKLEIPPSSPYDARFINRDNLKATMKTHRISDKFMSATVPDSPQNPLDQIERLAQLHKAGALTDQEFQSKKEELLKRL